LVVQKRPLYIVPFLAGSNLLGEKSLHSPVPEKSQISEISNVGKSVLPCSFLWAGEWIHKSPKYVNGSCQKRNVQRKAFEVEVYGTARAIAIDD